jgi:hypothetical protein
MKPPLIAKLFSIVQSFNVQVSVLYGMSECNGVVGCQLVNTDDNFVPMGYPLQGVQCLLINEQDQIICKTDNLSEIGQLYIGGNDDLFVSIL